MSFRLRWEFGSPIFSILLKKFAPSDTYRITKVGTYIRVDGTLRGLDEEMAGEETSGDVGRGGIIPKWKRGPFSIIIRLDGRGDDAKVHIYVLDHDKKVQEATDKGEDEEKNRHEIKGFHIKNVPKPEKIDVDGRENHEYHAWHDLFVVNLEAHDAKWTRILKTIEDFGQDAIDDDDMEKIKEDAMMSEESLRRALQFLYLNLLQYKKGESHSKVVAGGGRSRRTGSSLKRVGMQLW